MCDHQGIGRMHLALLLSCAIILCNLGSAATGPRSKKRGKSDIHQEGAGFIWSQKCARSYKYSLLISSSTFWVFRTYLRSFYLAYCCVPKVSRSKVLCAFCKHGLFYFTIWTIWTKHNLYNKFDLHILVSMPYVLLSLFNFSHLARLNINSLFFWLCPICCQLQINVGPDLKPERIKIPLGHGRDIFWISYP